MPHLVATLPEPQRAALAASYDQAVAARRRQMLLGVALFLLALAVSINGAEVDPSTFWNKLGNFTSYFDRLLTLDRRWTDSVADCYYAASRVRPGETASATVRRAGKELTLKIKANAGL